MANRVYVQITGYTSYSNQLIASLPDSSIPLVPTPCNLKLRMTQTESKVKNKFDGAIKKKKKNAAHFELVVIAFQI